MAPILRAAGFALPLINVVLGSVPLSMSTQDDVRAQQSPPFGHPVAGKTYPEYPGYTLYLVEEFTDALDLRTDPIWTYSDGALREGRVRYMEDGISFANGKMVITAEEIDDTIPQQSCSHAEAGPVTCKPLRSGELRTKHNQFRYGRYEVRMKAPMAQSGDPTVNGNYVATMFLYKDGKFKHWREIDIEVTGDKTLVTNVLYAENTTIYYPEIAKSGSLPKNESVVTDFHDYAFEWTPDNITFFYDGEPFRVYSGEGQVPVPDRAGKIMMSLWIWWSLDGGWWFGGSEGANNQYPFSVEYDWFRFYKWNGDSDYPCATLGDDCLTEDDKYLSSNNPCDGIPVGDGGEQRPTPCDDAICPSSANFTDTYNRCVPEATQPPPEATQPPTEPNNSLLWIILACLVLLCAGAGVYVSTQLGPAPEEEEQIEQTEL